MKVGTFVEHTQWGKGIVIEKIPVRSKCPFYLPNPIVLVLWNKPRTMKNGKKLLTLRFYETDLTIISGV
jgi:hypothetical protein